MNLIEFPGKVEFNDIPERLRELADQFDNAKHGPPIAMAYAFHDGTGFYAGALGNASDLELIGLASMATAFFQQQATEE